MPRITTINLKEEIIKKYGHELSIGYYYYSYNPVDLVGEEQVRKSFDSVKKYGKNVIIGDYESTDNIKEIVDEYGFTFLSVEQTPGVFFHESKIANKIIMEMKENFMCYLNFWCYYPDDFQDFILNWLKTNNASRKYLKMTGFATSERGKLGKTRGITHVVSTLLYRPFLYEARGYDERTSYHAGTRNYAVGLLGRVFKLQISEHFVKFVHVHHHNRHWSKVPIKQQKSGLKIAEGMANKITGNFKNGIKSVQNSYW